jgi:hypothetical protein
MRARSAPLKEFDMNAVITQSNTPARTKSRAVRKSLAIALGALALACSGGAAQAQSHGGFHGGGYHGGGWHGGYHGGGYYRGGGWGWGPWLGLGLGLGLAAPLYYDQPDVVYVNPPLYYPPATAYAVQAPAYATPAPVAPAPAGAPEPIFYPRNGQAAAQVEADRQACNRWATTQPRAMSDGSVFQRATLACMDGRGYTAR